MYASELSEEVDSLNDSWVIQRFDWFIDIGADILQESK